MPGPSGVPGPRGRSPGGPRAIGAALPPEVAGGVPRSFPPRLIVVLEEAPGVRRARLVRPDRGDSDQARGLQRGGGEGASEWPRPCLRATWTPSGGSGAGAAGPRRGRGSATWGRPPARGGGCGWGGGCDWGGGCGGGCGGCAAGAPPPLRRRGEALPCPTTPPRLPRRCPPRPPRPGRGPTPCGSPGSASGRSVPPPRRSR